MSFDLNISRNSSWGFGVPLMLLCLIIGCSTRVPKYSILRETQSPAGTAKAYLIGRNPQASIVSDTFFVIVCKRDLALTDVLKHIDDLAVLKATRAPLLQLQWRTEEQLDVACNMCGIEAIDVVKKVDRIGSIHVNYRGFPAHTAYDMPEQD